MRVQSGACNVCSAPCSSCMHNNRAVVMESEIECGSSHNSCAMKEADSCSFICADGMPPHKSRICDEQGASEASNLHSGSSSHDSVSENAESKATERASAACEGSDDVDMPPFEPLKVAVEQALQEKRSSAGDCLISSNRRITSDLCHRTCSNKVEQTLECQGDNISCLTGTKHSNTNARLESMDFVKKNAVSPALSELLLSRELERSIQTDCFYSSKNQEIQSDYRGEMTCCKGYFQVKCADSANAAFSDNPDSPRVPLPNHNSSPKVESTHFSFHSGCVIGPNGDYKVSDGSLDCQPLADGESSLGHEIAIITNDDRKTASKNGNSKENQSEDGFSAQIKSGYTEDENALGEGNTPDDVMKSSTIKNELEMPNSFVQEPITEKPELQLQQAMEGANFESEPELTDVSSRVTFHQNIVLIFYIKY